MGIEVPIEERHTPNVFLNAAMVSDRQIFADSKQIIVPPAQSFLTVEVKPDREQYEPREEGALTVTSVPTWLTFGGDNFWTCLVTVAEGA